MTYSNDHDKTQNDAEYLARLQRSAFATFCAEITTLPLCTLRSYHQSRLQIVFDAKHVRVPQSSQKISESFQQLWNRGGWRTFYAASPEAILGQMISTSSKFVLYKHFEDRKIVPQWFGLDPLSLSSRMVHGLMGGLCSLFITHPFDFCRILKQTQGVKSLPQFYKSIAQEIQSSPYGPLVVYRGWTKSVAKVAVGAALYFPLYDSFRAAEMSVLSSSFLTAVISTIFIQIPDFMKTRQVCNLPWFMGWFNIRPYFTGMTLNMGRIVPHFMITTSVMDYLHRRNQKSSPQTNSAI